MSVIIKEVLNSEDLFSNRPLASQQDLLAVLEIFLAMRFRLRGNLISR